MIDKIISHYRILEYLGAGGMGRVYRAKDLHLEREVALKFLPELPRQDLARERFEREARSAAAINHPNICTVYEIGWHDGTPFIAMELLQGETLDRKIPRKGVPVSVLLNWAIKITEGLNAAHSNGIIHRDLKPSNIFVTSSENIKILDFGLAKPSSVVKAALAGMADQTVGDITGVLSTPGTAIGTPAYMSPEQVSGEEVNEQSDLFSLGIVLYELGTGVLPFQGRTSDVVKGSILHEWPTPPTRLNSSLPIRLEEIVLKALEKDRGVRYQHAADLGADLKRLKRDLDSNESRISALHLTSASKRRDLRRPRWPLFTLVALVISAAICWLFWTPPAPTITGTVQLTNDGSAKQSPLVTDGSRVYFTAGSGRKSSPRQVSIRGGDSYPISTSFQDSIIQDISPDHSELLLIHSPGYALPWELWAAPTLGGSPRRVGNLTCTLGACAGWSPNGEQIVYVKDKELHLARVDGTGDRKLITVTGSPYWPRWSPDGRVIRFSSYDAKQDKSEEWELLANGTNLHLLIAESEPRQSCCGSWTPDGKYFVFNSADGNIWTIREGRTLRRRTQRPVRLTTGPISSSGAISSLDGKALYVDGYIGRLELVQYELKSGQITPLLGGKSAKELDYSRDGRWITYVTVPDGALWRSASDGSQRLELTTETSNYVLPRFSPDGKQIAFMRTLPGQDSRICIVPSDGGATKEVTTAAFGLGGDWDPTWSPDGKEIAFSDSSFVPGADLSKRMIHVVTLSTGRVRTLQGSQGMWSARWSPKGRFIAALASPPPRVVLYDLQKQQQTQIFDSHGSYPNWSPDGRFVYFASEGEDRAWWRVRIADRRPEKVRDLRDFPNGQDDWFTVTPNESIVTHRDLSSDQIYALHWDAR